MEIYILIIGAIFSFLMILLAYRINSTSQPKQLWMLFFTEMWERFSFYGMRALLILYITNVLMYDDKLANSQYGSYNALVYTMPLIGGWLADKILGYRKSIILGGILMAIGHLVLALPNVTTFFLGLGFLIVGNGFFKPNISSLLGNYYKDGENSLKDTGYSIFYMGVNIGAFLGSGLCGYLGQKINWHLGFGVAGFFMIIGIFVFYLNRNILEDKGFAIKPEFLNKVKFGLKKEFWIYIGSFLLVPIAFILVKFHELTTYMMIPFAILSFIYIIYISLQLNKEEKQKLWAALIMILFSIMFWGFYEQSGGSLNLMAERNVNFDFGGTVLSSAMVNNSLNPFYIIILTPLLGFLWSYLDKNKRSISISQKFIISFLLLAIGYFIFYLGGKDGLDSGKMALSYFFFAYLFITLGELFISPIGLSMITKLSPKSMFGLMMGVWFLASALGHKLAGWIGKLMAIPSQKPDGSEFSAVESLPIYMNGCRDIAITSIGVVIFFILISRLIDKWSHNIK